MSEEECKNPVSFSKSPVLKLASDHELLKGLSEEYLNLLGESAMLVRYKEGDLVFKEGDPANRFFLIIRGSVVLEAPRQDEASICIQTIGPGETLGWSWMFPPYRWHFDARADSDLEAVFFYGARLREQCEMYPDFGYVMAVRMAGIAIERLQFTRGELLAAKKAL